MANFLRQTRKCIPYDAMKRKTISICKQIVLSIVFQNSFKCPHCFFVFLLKNKKIVI